MKTSTDGNSRLRFLHASRVDSPAGDLGSLQLHSQADEPLGTLNGVLIDPGARQVRYFVVEKAGWFRNRKYLVPANLTAKVESERRTLRLDIDSEDLQELDEFDSRAVCEFSDEDTLEAMFARQVA